MIVILGLIIVIAAVIAGVAGVLANGGSAHALTHGFAVFGYHVTGSTGTLFLYGIVVGALALLGLTVLLAGARRTSRRGRAARRRLKQSRSETAAASQARDDLIEQRDNARAAAASDAAAGDSTVSPSPASPAASAPSPAASAPSPASPAASAPSPAASAPANGTARTRRLLDAYDGPLSRLRQFGRASAPRQATAPDPGSAAGKPAGKPTSDVLVDAPASDVPADASASAG